MTPASGLPCAAGRVVLRRLVGSDLAAFQAYRHDALIGLYQGWCPQTDEQSLAFIEQMAGAALFAPGDWFQIGIADALNGRLIGDIGWRVAADGASAEIGFSLCAQSQRQGLATEAVGAALRLLFESTDVDCVIGITDARNAASIRLLERLGMRRASTASAVFRGAPCTEHRFVASRPVAGGRRST